MGKPLSELPLSKLPAPSKPPQKLFAEPPKPQIRQAEMKEHMDDHMEHKELLEYFSSRK